MVWGVVPTEEGSGKGAVEHFLAFGAQNGRELWCILSRYTV